jgi:hypothetical protein
MSTHTATTITTLDNLRATVTERTEARLAAIEALPATYAANDAAAGQALIAKHHLATLQSQRDTAVVTAAWVGSEYARIVVEHNDRRDLIAAAFNRVGQASDAVVDAIDLVRQAERTVLSAIEDHADASEALVELESAAHVVTVYGDELYSGTAIDLHHKVENVVEVDGGRIVRLLPSRDGIAGNDKAIVTYRDARGETLRTTVFCSQLTIRD